MSTETVKKSTTEIVDLGRYIGPPVGSEIGNNIHVELKDNKQTKAIVSDGKDSLVQIANVEANETASDEVHELSNNLRDRGNPNETTRLETENEKSWPIDFTAKIGNNDKTTDRTICQTCSVEDIKKSEEETQSNAPGIYVMWKSPLTTLNREINSNNTNSNPEQCEEKNETTNTQISQNERKSNNKANQTKCKTPFDKNKDDRLEEEQIDFTKTVQNVNVEGYAEKTSFDSNKEQNISEKDVQNEMNTTEIPSKMNCLQSDECYENYKVENPITDEKTDKTPEKNDSKTTHKYQNQESLEQISKGVDKSKTNKQEIKCKTPIPITKRKTDKPSEGFLANTVFLLILFVLVSLWHPETKENSIKKANGIPTWIFAFRCLRYHTECELFALRMLPRPWFSEADEGWMVCLHLPRPCLQNSTTQQQHTENNHSTSHLRIPIVQLPHQQRLHEVQMQINEDTVSQENEYRQMSNLINASGTDEHADTNTCTILYPPDIPDATCNASAVEVTQRAATDISENHKIITENSDNFHCTEIQAVNKEQGCQAVLQTEIQTTSTFLDGDQSEQESGRLQTNISTGYTMQELCPGMPPRQTSWENMAAQAENNCRDAIVMTESLTTDHSLSTEIGRIETYTIGWSSTLPSPQQMAGAGFFFTGESDVVRCFCCGICIGEWLPEDDPILEHIRWSPDCCFIHRRQTQLHNASSYERTHANGQCTETHPTTRSGLFTSETSELGNEGTDIQRHDSNRNQRSVFLAEIEERLIIKRAKEHRANTPGIVRREHSQIAEPPCNTSTERIQAKRGPSQIGILDRGTANVSTAGQSCVETNDHSHTGRILTPCVNDSNRSEMVTSHHGVKHNRIKDEMMNRNTTYRKRLKMKLSLNKSNVGPANARPARPNDQTLEMTENSAYTPRSVAANQLVTTTSIRHRNSRSPEIDEVLESADGLRVLAQGYAPTDVAMAVLKLMEDGVRLNFSYAQIIWALRLLRRKPRKTNRRPRFPP